MATIKDVAREAGVSIALVSRCLNGKSGVSSEKAEAIRCAAEKLHYHPNQLAQSLVAGGTGVITVIADDLNAPETAAMIPLLTDAAAHAGYYAAFLSSRGDAVRKVELMTAFGGGRSDGVILLGDTDASLAECGSLYAPVVMMNGTMTGMKVPTLRMEHYDAALALTNALLDKRPWICYMKSDGDGEYEAGYRDAVTKRIGEDHVHIVTAGAAAEDGYACVHRLLSQGIVPNGFIVRNRDTAYGAVRGLLERGRRVPRDILVGMLENVWTIPTVTGMPAFPCPVPRDKETAEAAVRLIVEARFRPGKTEGAAVPPEIVEV